MWSQEIQIDPVWGRRSGARESATGSRSTARERPRSVGALAAPPPGEHLTLRCVALALGGWCEPGLHRRQVVLPV